MKRFPNLSASGGRSANPVAAAKRAFIAEVRKAAAESMEQAITQSIRQVEAESRGPKPTHRFAGNGGFRKPVTPNLLRAVRIDFDHRREVVQWAFDNLFVHGTVPIVSGEYKDAFKLYVNGKPATLGEIGFNQTAEIINEADYARMLEVGLRANGQPFVVQTKAHIVERIATTMLRRRFGKLATISFNYRDIPDPYRLKNDQVNSRGKVPKDRAAGSPIRYPAIILEAG